MVYPANRRLFCRCTHPAVKSTRASVSAIRCRLGPHGSAFSASSAPLLRGSPKVRIAYAVHRLGKPAGRQLTRCSPRFLRLSASPRPATAGGLSGNAAEKEECAVILPLFGMGRITHSRRSGWDLIGGFAAVRTCLGYNKSCQAPLDIIRCVGAQSFP